MSWIRSIVPPWMTGNQNTTLPDRRSQNPFEDRSAESRRHFHHRIDDEARQTAEHSHLQLQSHDDHQHQTQFRATHRIVEPFQNDRFRCDPTTAPARRSRQHPLWPPTHPVEPASPSAAPETHPVAAVHPVATRPSIPYTVRYNSSSETVLLPPVCQPSTLTGHAGSNTTFVDRLQSHDSGNSATSQATAATAAAESAPTTTAVSAAAAGGKGPPGTTPDGPTSDSEEDKIYKSAFYRNSRFTRHTLPEGWTPEPLVIENLPLRTFNGDIREYNEFRDDFIYLIQLQPHLSPQHKLQHLLTHLTGEPHALVKGFELVGENYCVVLDLLESRYGNKAAIEDALMQSLINIPQQAEQSADLTNYLQEVDTITRRLKRCGADVDNNRVCYSLLMNHLPVPLRLKLIQSYGCRGTKKVSCVLDGLRQYLSDIEEAEEHALSLRRPCPPAPVPAEPEHLQARPKDSGEPHTPCENQQDPSLEDNDDSVTPSVEAAASAVNTSSDDRLKEHRTCSLCSRLHLAANCFMYPTIQKRLRRVLKLKICLLCLRREGHQASECPRRTKSPCKTCGHGQHHRILCKDADENRRHKSFRSGQMRATTGTSLGPKGSDRKRSSRKKSVVRAATSCVTAAPVRHSGTQRSSSSRKSIPNRPKGNRKKKTWNCGADSQGRAGTARPTSSSTDKRMKHKTAKAHGNDRFLPARYGQLQTAPFATNHESASAQQGPRNAEEDSPPESSDSTPLQPQANQQWTARPATDEELQLCRWRPYYPSDDDVSLPPFPGHCSTPDPFDWNDSCHAEHSNYVACAPSTTEPTTLLECIKVTAENPTTGNARNVIVFFDSGSTRSFVSTELAHDLSLPRHQPCSIRVNTFGSMLTTTIEGFSTSIVLRNKHRRLQSLALIASSCIVPSIRTALVEQSQLPKLRRGELVPVPTQVTPDILIGQDLTAHFKRRYGPTLPYGFFVVKTILGPLLGGSGKVPATVPVAARSSEAVSSTNTTRRSLTSTDPTPPSPSLHRNLYRMHNPTHPVEKCTDFASDPALTQPVEKDPDAPPRAVHQDFSLTVEKNEFPRSTASTSRLAARCSLSDGTKGPRSPRKLQNPLDTTAPLPPSTSNATLRPELQTEPRIPTSRGYVSDRNRPVSVQQNPAHSKPRKTRLKRRLSTFGRSVLGTKNPQVLRKCETMRHPLDQPRPATDTSVHAVPETMDPKTHLAQATFPEAHFPDVVCVATELTPKDRKSRPAAEPPSPAYHAGNGGDAAAAPSPINLDGTEQAQHPRSHQNQEPPSSTILANSPGEKESSHEKTASSPKSDCDAGLTSELSTSQDLEAKITARTTTELQAVTTRRNKSPAAKTPSPAHPAGNGGDPQFPPRPAYPAGIGAEAAVIPSPTHRVGKEKAQDLRSNPNDQLTSTEPCRQQPRRTVTTSKTDHGDTAPNAGLGHPSHMPTGSNQHPTATTRRVIEHEQGCQGPCIANHDARVTPTKRFPIPVIDGCVSMSFAAFLASGEVKASSAVHDDLPPQHRFIGLINHLGVPPTYLPPAKFQPIEPNDSAQLALLTIDQIAQENDILPWNLNLGSTLGALPPYSVTVTSDTCLHLHEEAQSAVYRLNIRLPDRATTPRESPYDSPGPARRADHTDQRITAPSCATIPLGPVVRGPPRVTTKATCRTCAFCGSRHSSTECTTFGTANQRLGRAEKRKLCLLCLREGHKAAECPDRTTSPCQHCHRGQHHPALCRSLRQAATAAAPTPLLTKTPPDVTHPVARDPRSARRSPATGTFPPAMNHFRVDQPPKSTKAGTRARSRSAKKRSAAVPTPAQAPSTQPSIPRPKRTVVYSSGNQYQVQFRNPAEEHVGTKPAKTSSEQRTSHTSNSSPTHPVGNEIPNHPPHGEKKERSFRDGKTRHRSRKPTRAMAKAPSTSVVVVPAEAHQQQVTAEDRHAPKRKNREPKKRRH